jgi:methyl-accepting chemotaxis protein
VDIFTIGGQETRAVETAPAPRGIKGLQQKFEPAAKSYLSHGNAAVDREWSEF